MPKFMVLRHEAVETVWSDDDPASDGGWVYEVEEHRRWTDAQPALRRTVFLVRNPALDSAGFAARYAHHATLARVHHPSICEYTQNVVVRAVTPGAPWFDGVSELGFWDRQAMLERHYDSPEGEALMQADIAGFLDPSKSVAILEETP